MSKLIVILGPTASGKTELAIKLAKKLALRASTELSRMSKIEGFKGVEIVSADSRQVYKGMDIGTGKVTKKKMKGISHHLLDVALPNQEFNVAVYKKLAIQTIKDIQRRGKVPFLVGGTGLYIQAVVDNIDFPEVTPQRQLREGFEKKTIKELFEIYKKLDPEGAKFIEKKNKRRLIRAIEVCKVTGKPFSEQRKKGKPLFEVLEIGLKLNREELKKRVVGRVEKMIKLGLEEEVEKLVKKYGFNISPLQTIGYQEWFPYFYPSPLAKGVGVEGKITKEEVKQNIKTHTLQFAKRQMTWFKRDKRIRWVKDHRKAGRLIKEFLK